MKRFLQYALFGLVFSTMPAFAEIQAPQVVAQPETAQIAEIETTLDLLASLVDRKDYDALARILHDEIRLDYTSLWGEQPTTLSRDDVLASWSGLLPGFDATRHVFGNYSVAINGRSAVVTGAGVATHWLDKQTWIVGGQYRWSLTYDGDEWRIDGITFDVLTETGDRNLTKLAAERVKH